jgi:capsular exopolysaccharide synthesis family protein
MQQETDKFQKKLPNQEIDYFKIGKILLSRWYWVAGMVLICMGYAKFYLWVTPKTYQTSATLKFEEKKSELADLGAGGIIANDRNRIQSEQYVIQSSQLLLRAIKKIDYRISFYLSGRVRTTETYPQKPLDIQFISLDSTNFFRDQLTFKAVNKNTFNLSYKEGNKTIQKNYVYNNPVTIGPTTFTIKYPGELSSNTIYIFNFNSPENFLGRVKGGLHTGEIMKNSNIISLSQTDLNPVFAADILNKIMDEYLLYDREQKTKSALQIIKFIDKQLDFLSDSVKSSERSLQQYKQKNKIINVSTASDAVMSKSKEIESQRSLLKIQLMAIDQLKEKLIREKDNININFDLSGSLDPLLNGIIASFNNALTERNTLLKIYNNNSKPIRDINAQIIQIKSAALANVNSTRETIQKNLAYLDAQSNTVNQQIAVLPVAERDMISLQRDFEINEKVYAFLSEKKIDAQISSSAILPGASIVDRAQPNFGPIGPNEQEINRNALIIGLVSGLAIIILIRMLNPYIYDKETVESLTTIPIIGVIRKFPASLDENNSELLALSKPRSIFAESVRSVRTNLNFLASEKESKVICITSEVAGEGKSFVAVNLSSTLALINKKVVLIGADLRRSRIHKTFGIPNDIGLSNYLANQATSTDIIHHSEVENLDFIISGPVPPNPSELLHSHKMNELIAELKTKYDIIVIDTAPIGLVSDSIPLIRVSDINVFVIRSGKSKYYAATVPQRIAQEYHLDNTVIVLNAFEEDLLHSRYYTTRFTGEGYGTRYYYYSDYSGYTGSGYYVDDEEKKWWNIKRWFKL